MCIRIGVLCTLHIPGNVAYHKSASESMHNWGKSFPAVYAVDGNTDSRITGLSCAHPDSIESRNAWWMVDFGETHNIIRVIMYNRDTCE